MREFQGLVDLLFQFLTRYQREVLRSLIPASSTCMYLRRLPAAAVAVAV